MRAHFFLAPQQHIMTITDTAANVPPTAEGSAAPAASRDADNSLPANDEEEKSSSVNDTIALHQQDDDDDMTIIGLDQDLDEDINHHRAAALAWMEQNGPEMEERRRSVLLRELHRVQRASFIQFILLCMIPTALLCIVIATVLGDEEPCGSDIAICRQEPRTFMNAFTTRCICDAIDVNREG